MNSAIYLDYNATAPLRPAVLEAMTSALGACGNPSSVHRFGRQARRQVEDARARVAALVGAAPGDVVFTGGGTEANNLALKGARDADGRAVARVLVSAVEHDSVWQAAAGAEEIPVGTDGIVDLDALEELLRRGPGPALVCIMLANNETGVIQPVGEAARIAHRHGALVHCDAVQAVGKIPVDRAALGVDLLSFSAHKLGGPQGVGALVVGAGVTLAALIEGGGQERGRRAGTENVAGIVGFGAAAVEAGDGLEAFARLAALRDRLEDRARALVPGMVVFGGAAPRLANTSCLAHPSMAAETQVMALDLAGVAVSAGAACSSGKVAPSRVLRAMGADAAAAADRAIRVSLGWDSGAADVDRFLAAWGALGSDKGRLARAVPAA